jgi:hypothetical protein
METVCGESLCSYIPLFQFQVYDEKLWIGTWMQKRYHITGDKVFALMSYKTCYFLLSINILY